MNYNLNEMDVNNIPSEIVYSLCLEHEVDINSEPNPNIDENKLSSILEIPVKMTPFRQFKLTPQS